MSIKIEPTDAPDEGEPQSDVELPLPPLPDAPPPDLHMALAMAQPYFSGIPKNRTATIQTKNKGTYSYKYADLADILKHIRVPMGRCGLYVIQPIINFELVTIVGHISGEQLRSELALPRNIADPQALGSWLTYNRRYCVCAALGIAAEQDDDGQLARDAGMIGDMPQVALQQSQPNRNFDPRAQPLQPGQMPAYGQQPADWAAPPVAQQQPIMESLTDKVTRDPAKAIDRIRTQASDVGVTERALVARYGKPVDDFAVPDMVDALRQLHGVAQKPETRRAIFPEPPTHPGIDDDASNFTQLDDEGDVLVPDGTDDFQLEPAGPDPFDGLEP